MWQTHFQKSLLDFYRTKKVQREQCCFSALGIKTAIKAFLVVDTDLRERKEKVVQVKETELKKVENCGQ